ncbi:MAG: ABC transporter permease, partial [Coprococcus sp.]
MYFKLLKNDFKRNPWNNLIILGFMTLSVTLAVSVCLMLTQLFTSITDMYKTSRPPHFLQMHKGELDQKDIDEFNSNYPGVEYWQTVPMIDLYGDEITVIPLKSTDIKYKENIDASYTLSDCRIDISLVKQNEKYDVLLDGSRNKVEVEPGEIGVPVILLDDYKINIGDTILIKSKSREKTFVVTEYIYDGQMNSTLCSSTRFLISDKDFDEMFGAAGETEYLIETYFNDSSQAAAYQTEYEQSEKNLPKNGQAVTYTIIFLLSAMTDIMMALVLVLTGILLIVIAMICLRYTILAELEEDMKEIGTMKALGISGKGIRNLYLGKIKILMGAGCILGMLISIFLVSMFTGHMNRTFGEQKTGMSGMIFAVPVCIAIYFIVIIFSKNVLRKLRRASVTDLLVTEKGFGYKKSTVTDGIHKSKRIPINLLLGFCEMRQGYGIIFGLLLIVSFIMFVPYRMIKTMENEEFITYMGSSVCDVLLEVEQGNELESRKSAAEELLMAEKEQGTIIGFDSLKRVRLQAVGKDGEYVGIHIDTGKCAGYGLRYLEGSRPAEDMEIALSCMMAEELEKSVGDTLILNTCGRKQEFTISGIYQDVTSGGRTAKAVCDFADIAAEQYTFQITIKQDCGLIDEWRNTLGNGYSVENMEEFVDQTLGGVTMQIKRGAVA